MFSPETRIAVTGASGHIGNNLVRELLRRGHRVRAVVHAPSPSLRGPDVETVVADVRHPETLRAAFRGIEVVFRSPLATFRYLARLVDGRWLLVRLPRGG